MTRPSAPGSTKPTRRRSAGDSGRSIARLAAAQALYQIELGGAPAEAVLAQFLDQRLGEEIEGLRLATANRALLSDLVQGVDSGRAELDGILAGLLEADWPVERLETLLGIVLRAGLYELSRRGETPARVVISEYVDLAAAFFGGKEPGLVNAVLDRAARTLRPEEFQARAPR